MPGHDAHIARTTSRSNAHSGETSEVQDTHVVHALSVGFVASMRQPQAGLSVPGMHQTMQHVTIADSMTSWPRASNH